MLNGLKMSKSQNVIEKKNESSNTCIPSGVTHVSPFCLRLPKIFYPTWRKNTELSLTYSGSDKAEEDHVLKWQTAATTHVKRPGHDTETQISVSLIQNKDYKSCFQEREPLLGVTISEQILEALANN